MDQSNSTHTQLLNGATDTLRQLSANISNLTDQIYTRESQALPGSTIGKHVRHLLDHFNILITALSNNTPLATVNYSSRVRDTVVESSVKGGQDAIDDMAHISLLDCNRMLEEGTLALRTPIRVIDVLPSGAESAFMSTLGREFWFCIHHMVHHNAIIASLMYEFGCTSSKEFAYAPSTAKALKQQQQQQATAATTTAAEAEAEAEAAAE
ncbi:hypothetical protein GGI07_005064 [Coemansia sp. Benny D115]|nr:hypothetical protein GGI07_005064 [Coemansia sp. Benny D115]